VKVHIQFVEEATAENPFPPRTWGFVPRAGDTVMLPETGRVYRILEVRWACTRRADGSYDENDPHVIIRVED